MEDPMKIIHKYKNNNSRIQYQIHIFLGDILDENCMRILRKIKDLDLFTSLVSLDDRELNILEKNYGEYWYEKFFNSYHINNTKESVPQNPAKLKELKSIYDNKWIAEHFTNYKKRAETISYNYETMIKEERERKNVKKFMQKQQYDADEIIDYTTSGKPTSFSDAYLLGNEYIYNGTNVADNTDANTDAVDNANMANENTINDNESRIKSSETNWCSDESSSDNNDTGYTDDNIGYTFDSVSDSDSETDAEILELDEDQYYEMQSQRIQTGGADADDTYAELDFEQADDTVDTKNFEEEVEADLENADMLFGDIDETDKDIKLTTRKIKEAISNETYDKINKKIADFDTSKDNNMFDENLKDVYSKNYITHQYIYKDDTIKMIHKKICCGFKNNPKFSDQAYIIPSYQYLWSEYQYNDKINKVMLGQKWIVKNDVLKLDVEPVPNIGVYEDLRGGLKALRDNIKRQGKIKREDDDNNILFDYQGYYTYNELYMVDIYNELGINYDPNYEELKNLIDVYIRIYFPKIRIDDIAQIIEFLNKNQPDNAKNSEKNKLKMIYDTDNNDLILENEIMKDIELVKKKNTKEYTKIFKENYVTQSVIRAYLLDRYKKIDLYRIFDNFMLDDNYPFIQYQPADGTPKYRYNEKYLIENVKKEIVMKWFENSPYGISFKVRVLEDNEYKYMAINLSDSGRVDYKIQWKEEDMSTVDDIADTYQYIRKLINKINSENERFPSNYLNMPADEDFKFAFINTIQKFELPNDFIINHNDLSEFSRYFFPYVALVIEPRKRQSKLNIGEKNDKSKFGTYLRYKRVSKYENRTKIEHRIIFFMRNYEYDDQSLANEISKEFNITEEQAFLEIENVREKYPNIRKSRKVLKKLENIPKYKPPGIGVDIQGKSRNRYKMRIAGARDKEQLYRIINFMNILIYLYTETFLYKKPDRQKMLKTLKRLTKIARRRNKVDEIVKYETSIRNVKQITSNDKKRLGNKSDTDRGQWTRECQNYENKPRRPQQYLSVDDLLKLGYEWKESLDGMNFGHYERKVIVDADGNTTSNKKKQEVALRAVKLPLDDTGENFVYYACGPEENKKHMYIGFLQKSKNPGADAAPCCFIKDHLYSKNKEKRNFYLQSIGIIPDDDDANIIKGDQLYILQDSNKVQEGRFAFLPKYLDIFMNYMLGNDKVIKNHYLTDTSTGYYFKYGAKQDEYKYLNAICSVFDLTVEEMKAKMINALSQDKTMSIFTSLNNGDIRAQFGDIKSYISYIKNNEYLEYPLLNDLLCLPGVIRKAGINIVIFQKKIRVIRKTLEKEKIKESYYIVCQNIENIDDNKNPNRETTIVIKENKNYYPIVLVQKVDPENKTVNITKTFYYGTDNKNIINHIYKYNKISCQSEYQSLVHDTFMTNLNAKDTYNALVSLNKKEYLPKKQVVDARFKCKFLITNGGFIIPTIPSGTIYYIGLATSIDTYIKDYATTFGYLLDLYELSNQLLKFKPVGIYYREKKEKSYLISAIMTNGSDAVPITERLMTMEYVKKENLHVQSRPNDEILDKEIMKGKNNIVVDDRVYAVSKNKYDMEIYQLFRYHLSYYLTEVPAGIKYREKLMKIMNDTKIPKRNKKLDIKQLLYKMSNSDLAKTFNELVKNIDRLSGGFNNAVAKSVPNTANTTNKYLTEANTPVNIVDDKVQTVQIIPDNFNTKDKRPVSNLRDMIRTPETAEFSTKELIPIGGPNEFTKNEAPSIPRIHFPSDEKSWLHTMSNSKKIDYPSFILENNRKMCYTSNDKDSCNEYQHCNWINSKNMCMLSVKQDMLIDYINQVAEELVQNEMKAQEILKIGEYFVSDIVSYNVFTERPGEKIIMSSNTNLNKILSEIFGKINIPSIGKRRNKLASAQNYELLNINNPLKDNGDWLTQNIIENNISIFRAFANAYYWLMHPYNNISVRNLGYYSSTQTNLAHIYKSQVIDWLIAPENGDSIAPVLTYIKNSKVSEFAIKLSVDIHTSTNCLIELFIMSRINHTVIYVNNDNNDIIYAFHPTHGFVYDHKKHDKKFDISKYINFKKILNLRFSYYSKNSTPDKIEVMYPKK